MKTRFLSILSTLALTAAAAAQPTAFTYQGRLKNGAALAAGLHDFRFTLFNVVSGGVQVAPPQCVDNLAVTEGIFTTTIDFGQQFATTSPRFLQIEVRADTGLSCANPAGLVVLGPRQLLTAAPLASHAISAARANAAFALDAPDGSPLNAVFVDNAGLVGIGTTTPGGRLDIQGSNNSNILFGRSTGGALAHNLFIDGLGNGSMQLLEPNGTPGINLGSGNSTYFNYGNVGIGTTSPAAKLDVRGDIRLGNNGQYRAAAGEENLRIVRGAINSSGGIVLGSGFTVIHTSGTDTFTVNFTTPFNGAPVVTATVDNTGFPVSWIVCARNVSSGTATFLTRSGSNASVEVPFFFIAIGPR